MDGVSTTPQTSVTADFVLVRTRGTLALTTCQRATCNAAELTGSLARESTCFFFLAAQISCDDECRIKCFQKPKHKAARQRPQALEEVHPGAPIVSLPPW